MSSIKQSRLNTITKATKDAKLGDVIVELITQVNSLSTKFNALLTKLDSDAANTALNDTNYNSTLATSVTISTIESR